MFSALCHAEMSFKVHLNPYNVPYHDLLVVSTHTEFTLQEHNFCFLQPVDDILQPWAAVVEDDPNWTLRLI